MGVTGLWKLIDASGKPVPLETLENKVLAIDISIWLHQVVKGFQDNKGATLPNAHLLGLFHRLCKLLFYRIKPVFVFDGGCPVLKRETIRKRSQAKNKLQQEADRLQQLLLENLAKEKVVQQALGVNAKFLVSPKKAILPPENSNTKDDLFKLPPIGNALPESIASASTSSSAEESDETPTKTHHNFDLHTIDVKSSYFQSLPADIRHEILTDLKETRKQSSWGRLHELPAESNNFSNFQMARLLKRRQVQVSLEEAEQEMGGKCLSMAELETLLNEEGFETEAKTVGKHVASDENTRYLLVKDIKALMETGKMSDKAIKKLETIEETKAEGVGSVLGDEFDHELQKAIEMSLTVHELDGDGKPLAMDEMKMSEEQKKAMARSKLSCAKEYMLEYGGMSSDNIKDLLATKAAGVDEDEENDVEATQYYFNEDYIIKGDVPTPEPPAPKVSEVINLIQTSEKGSQDSVGVSSGTDSDSDFVDVPDDELPELEGLPKLAVLPVRKDYMADGTPSKDFRLEDLKLPRSGMEIVIQSTDTPVEDDIFADIFANKLPASVQVEKTPEKLKLPATPQVDETVIELSDGEDEVKQKKQAALDKFLQQMTPSRTPTKNKISEEENVPKVPSPFFVNRTPPSSKKQKIDSTTEMAKTGKGVSKALFVSEGEASTSSKKANSLEEVFAVAVEKLKADSTKDELQNLAEQLREENVDLMAEKNKQNRMGVSITEQMSKDCMQLLRLFGIPYIVAPMEAESQCAFLNAIDLTDGTITDDSDIWLFGGKKVYKNFFNQKKLVMEYEVENIERLFQMDRNKMIQLAMLVGSDYTTGINGIGAVTALEILATFPSTPEQAGETTASMSMLSGLRKFREWLVNGKNSTTTGRGTLKNKLKNVEIIEGFPNFNIADAYLHPVIDDDTGEFTWGVPNVEELYEFTKQTLGWTRSRTDDILVPVLKKLNEKKNQQSITNYFKVKSITSNAELTVSKRVKKAIDIMAGKIDPNAEEKPKAKGKRKPKATPVEGEPADTEDEPKTKRKPRTKKEKPAEEEPQPSTSQAVVERPVSPSIFDDPILVADDDSDNEKFSKPSEPVAVAKPKGRKRHVPEKPQIIGGISRVISKINSKSAIAMGGPLAPAKRANRTPIIPNPSPKIPQRESNLRAIESNRLKAAEMLKNAKMNKK